MEIKNMEEFKDLMEIFKKGMKLELEHDIKMMWLNIGAGRKIQAIKHYMAATNTPLYESKLYVENLMQVHKKAEDV